jgi:hypothetical protein
MKASIDAWTVSAGVTIGALLPSINKYGRAWEQASAPRSFGVSCSRRQKRVRFLPGRPTIFDALAPVRAINLAVNMRQFSFCWATFPYRRRNATWWASSDFLTSSMIELDWSPIRRDLLMSRTACLLRLVIAFVNLKGLEPRGPITRVLPAGWHYSHTTRFQKRRLRRR